MKGWLLMISLLVMGSMAWSQNLTKQTISDKVGLSVPEDFRRLTAEEAQRHYLSPTPPLAMWADAQNELDLSVTQSRALFDSKDVELMKAFYKSTIRSLYTRVTFHQELTTTINGRKAAVFEFSSELAEKGKPTLKKYTYVQYLVRATHITVFTFTCDERLRPKYHELAAKIMKTARA